MKIIVLESLTFGLNRLADAAIELGFELYLFTYDRSLYQYELDHGLLEKLQIIEVNTFDDEAIINAAKGIGKIDGVINLTDTWCFKVIELSKKLGLYYQNEEIVHRIRNKFLMRNYLYKNKLTSSNAILIDKSNFSNIVPLVQQTYPAIIKEVSGTGSRNVWLVHDINSASDKINALNKNIRQDELVLTMEAYFQGTLYSAETLSWNGKTTFLAITSRGMSDEPYFREDITSLPVHFPQQKQEEIKKWISNVLATLGYTHGYAHTEFIVTSKGLEVVEVNPRLGGGLIGEMLSRTYSVNIYKALIEMALGCKPSLMNTKLEPTGGYADFVVYAKEIGVYDEIKVDNQFKNLCGNPDYFTAVPNAKQIDYLNEYRSTLGLILAGGETSEIALFNVNAAANRIGNYVKNAKLLEGV